MVTDTNIDPLTEAQLNILRGNFQLNNLPSIEPRIIRIFVCAPYEDTNHELNSLFTNVFPKLRDFSMSRYGLEFQAVDLFWGINNTLNLNTQKENLLENFLIELNKCQNYSIGMTFLAIVGDEFGSVLLPRFIERKHFETIIECLEHQIIDTTNLKTFYSLNINYLSNKYELIGFDDITKDIENELIYLLDHGSNIGIEKKLLTKVCLNNLNKSILEVLMNKGAFKNPNKNDKVFSLVRLLQESSSSTSNPSSNDTKKIKNLKDKEINYHLPGEQIYRLKINQVDKVYLRNFEKFYQNIFEELIEKFVRLVPESKYPIAYQDALYHFHHIKSNDLKEVTPKSECVMKTLCDYIFEENTNQPLVITGPVGSGKTTYASTLASNLYLHFIAHGDGWENALVIRFIGIDGKSMYLRNLLKSLCQQLDFIHNDNLEVETNKIEKLSDLKNRFKNYLVQSSQKKAHETNKKLVIILDSLNQLCTEDNAHKLDWLPKNLSANCKMILTVSSESTDMMKRLQRKYIDENSFVVLSGLEKEQADIMMQKYLSLNDYRLEENQVNLIKNLTEKKRIFSLHMKLLSEQFLSWKSNYEIEKCVLKDTLSASVEHFISGLETRFDKTLVKYILSYITITKNGISELELQDILSLDNNILEHLKVKESINQPKNLFRMPWLYISEILIALRAHLITRPFNGIYTIYWRHSIFHQVTYERYLKKDKEFEMCLHRNISDYLLGTWSSSNLKPFKYEKITVPKDNEEDTDILTFDKPIVTNINMSLDRLVPKQPIRFKDFHTNIPARYNLRKLSILPHHLLKANMKEVLEKVVYFNIDWIYSKINAFDVQQLIYDFDLYKSSNEVNIVCECLKMSEPVISKNSKFLFNEMSGRLLPFYTLYTKVKYLVDQCDEMSLKLNPILPVGQSFNSPSWIIEKNIDLGIDMTNAIYLSILESEFNGRILSAKNSNDSKTKFYDLDLLECMNEVDSGQGQVYCSRNGEFVCNIGEGNKFIIKRVETGDLYGVIDLDSNEIGQISLSNNYATLNFRKAPSPLLINLNKCKIIELFPYQTSFSAISPDEQVILIHSEKSINYHLLATLERKISLDSYEIPEIAIFTRKNKEIFVLYKDTKQVIHYKINLEKNIFTSEYILQDRDIKEMKTTLDENVLLIRSLHCIYVFDTKSLSILHKLKTKDLNEFNSTFLSKTEVFNGFGCTLDNKIIYATLYTFLICYSMETGNIIRVFQSTLSANRIVKSYSCLYSDALLSLLDNGQIIQWNLKTLGDNEMKFDDMKVFSSAIKDCCLPQIPYNSNSNIGNVLSYCDTSPDVKCSTLRGDFKVKTSLRSYDVEIDNPLTTSVKLCVMDQTGRFCLILNEIEDFAGKRYPMENNFIKNNCTVIDLMKNGQIIEQFSYVVRKNSRFEIQADFLYKNNGSYTSTYLIIKVISCINDFDPYYAGNLDWSEFETNVKVFELSAEEPCKLNPFAEFKMFGECLNDEIIVTKNNLVVSLMHECCKLYDKNEVGIVRAKRYDCHLNIYNVFVSQKLKLHSLNEFLTMEQFHHQNVLIDVRCVFDTKLLLIFSKEGARSFKNGDGNNSEYDYNYDSFRFDRDIETEKSGLIFDTVEEKIIEFIPKIFSKSTNVETLITSNKGYVLDNNWNLYDLKKRGKLLRNFGNLDISFKWSKFVFNGNYIITVNKEEDQIFLVRCYDSFICASFMVSDKISCLKMGEFDRTIGVGTKNGYLLALKLLIDLEYNEAMTKFVGFYRNPTNQNQILSHRNYETKQLRSDMKRVIHSAHAHRQLKSRENRSTSSVIVLDRSEFLKNETPIAHNEINKRNMANLSCGIRHASVNRMESRACNIQ